MIFSLLKRIFGSRNERWLKQHRGVVERINALESAMQALSDEALQGQAEAFRKRLQEDESLDDLLPEVFAAVRESAHRHIGLRHFDCQMHGGLALHEGKIAEMRTGEGKTLVATLAASLNAIAGRGVHLVTVNDYLASRDAEWMGAVYRGIGLSVGVAITQMDTEAKQEAYACDITYGTNSEFGFDYLRDNMALQVDGVMQRKAYYAIVDEVDSILIDEARTPLVISGAAEDDTLLYQKLNKVVRQLQPTEDLPEEQNSLVKQKPVEADGDYTIDLKTRQVSLTEAGHERVEQLLGEQKLLADGKTLYDRESLVLVRCLQACLRAEALFQRNVHYIVRGGEVVLVDEHTGRTMQGRRMSEGVHQALECKERVKIQSESRTFASTTYQNYFRLYEKLAGMTGTAETEAVEFKEIYGLDVMLIPTNKPMIRNDENDLVFSTSLGKVKAVIQDIRTCHEQGQPVLVGTASIESSEELSRALKNAGLKHQVLNAKQHAKEARVIAQAGKPGAITIATNMAGRGTDIVLGGNWEHEAEKAPRGKRKAIQQRWIQQRWQESNAQVLEAGGLRVISTERHESRRIDNQLRGRSGRQGDPGSSRFYLSMEDPLLKLFISDRIKNMMQNMGRMEEDDAIESGMLTSNIERAQRRVEGRYFDIRKNLLEYDNVANEQRKVVYQQRAEILQAEDTDDIMENIRNDVLDQVFYQYIPLGSVFHQWDVKGLQAGLQTNIGVELPVEEWVQKGGDVTQEELYKYVCQGVEDFYQDRREKVGQALQFIEKQVLLRVMDEAWRDHLAAMDYLRQSIHLRAYAQRNPKQEYSRESFELFHQLLDRIRHETIQMLATVRVREPTEEEARQLSDQGAGA